MEEIGDDAVMAAFEWDAGGTGQMFLRWVDGEVVDPGGRLVRLDQRSG